MNFAIPNILGGLIFGAIGFVAFSYGKKQSLTAPMAIGILLMVFPYFITGTLAVYGVGLALTALLYFFR